ncbi:MAG: T9SS type A sorting domain-containing protein [Bacteroidetes bacterium]|nr:T9SS type A sorting domain-containing protein [Bacteroidota bacterium]
MKYFIGVLLCLLINTKGIAQWVTIQDSVMSQYLNTYFPGCMNGNNLDTVCASAAPDTLLIMTTLGTAQTLYGLQYFTNVSSVNLSTVETTNIDYLPPNLKHLYIKNVAYIVSLSPLPQGLLTLDISGTTFSSFPTVPSSVQYLNMSYSSEPVQITPNLKFLILNSKYISTIPSLPPGLEALECNWNLLTSLPAFPSSLKTLTCSQNYISNLPTLPASLEWLNCNDNDLTNLPLLPNNLSKLECRSNQLVALPTLPSILEYIDCSINQLQNLPPLPQSIVNLQCSDNTLMSLPLLPSGLTTLNCRDNPGITSLPALNNGLISLNCANNGLTILPSLPSSLNYLDCSINQISQLPALPPGLKSLGCGQNPINSLPLNLPQLELLGVGGTLITTLPNLPNSLKELYISSSLIQGTFTVPDSMIALYMDNSIGITCMPDFSFVETLRFQNTSIQCVPFYNNFIDSDPPLGSFPICDPLNLNNCAFRNNIFGTAYHDINANGIKDMNENVIEGVKINLMQTGMLNQQTYTVNDGKYNFKTPYGTYEYFPDTINQPISLTFPLAGYHVSTISASDSVDYGMDFGIKCKQGFDVGVLTIDLEHGQLFPADSALFSVHAGDMSHSLNLNCAQGISGQITIQLNGPGTFGSVFPGSVQPIVFQDSIVYNISDFGTFNFFQSISFYIVTDTTAQIGDSICFSISVTPVNGDNNISNNYLTHCFPVSNSYDPNDKSVFPSSAISNASPEWLTYTIRFQNTGNAPAQNIIVTDTLDALTDWSSFEILNSSHYHILQMEENRIKFIFPNISLPDSISDEPNSHGMIKYKIKTLPNLSPGDSIKNVAYIFFDFNPAVITNTTINYVPVPSSINSIDENEFTIFPSIADNIIYITNKNQHQFTIEVFDMLGFRVKSTICNSSKNELNISDLRSGSYILKATFRKDAEYFRFIKL